MALRSQFLGHFAAITHIGPRELDELRMNDFASLVLFIEHELQRRNQQQQQH